MFYYLFLCVMAVLGFGPILLKSFLSFMAYFGEIAQTTTIFSTYGKYVDTVTLVIFLTIVGIWVMVQVYRETSPKLLKSNSIFWIFTQVCVVFSTGWLIFEFMGPVWIGLSEKWNKILGDNPITFSFLAIVGCTTFFGMLAYKIYKFIREKEKERNDFMELVPWLKILNSPKVKSTERFRVLSENEEDTRDCENQITGITKVEPDDGLWTLPFYKYFRRYFFKKLV